MSGSLTIPFATAGLYVSNATNRLLYGGLAAASGLFAAYRIWLKEYCRADALEQRIRPQLAIHIDHPSCYQQDESGAGPYQMWRVVVVNKGVDTIEAARVSLVDMSPMPEEFGGRLPLPLRPQHEVNATTTYAARLFSNDPKPIDVIGWFSKTAPDKFVIFHTARHLVAQQIPVLNVCCLTIQAAGVGVLPVERRFITGIDTMKKLFFRPVEEPVDV